MGGLFSKPAVQKPDDSAVKAQADAQAQADADRARKSKQLAAQKRASTYGGNRSLLYAGRDDAQMGVQTGSGAMTSSLGSSTV